VLVVFAVDLGAGLLFQRFSSEMFVLGFSSPRLWIFHFSVRAGAADFRFVIFYSGHRFPPPPVSAKDLVFGVDFSCRASDLHCRSSFFDLSFLGLAIAGPCLLGRCIRFPLRGFLGPAWHCLVYCLFICLQLLVSGRYR
jgi:hypothetical protein